MYAPIPQYLAFREIGKKAATVHRTIPNIHAMGNSNGGISSTMEAIYKVPDCKAVTFGTRVLQTDEMDVPTGPTR